MRTVHRLVVGLSLAASGALGCGSGGTDPATDPPPKVAAEVSTPGQVFSPTELRIIAGDSVRFNITGSHNVIFNRAAGAPPDVPVVTNTAVWRTFATRGTFPYDCTVHPGMSGEIVVQ
jgi:plastocyanin